MDEREVHKGDKVVLRLRAASSSGITPGLRALDGRTFRVKRVKQIKTRREHAPAAYGIYYELRGCESALGVPFAILRERLLPV